MPFAGLSRVTEAEPIDAPLGSLIAPSTLAESNCAFTGAAASSKKVTSAQHSTLAPDRSDLQEEREDRRF